MIYLAYIVLVFTGIQLVTALMNVVLKQRLPKSDRANNTVLVSILIPARNEERTIGNLLNDLQQQDYQNIEMFVYNDQSTDKTVEIVEQFTKNNTRIHLIDGQVLPEGWLGKNHACYTAAQHASGSFLLFLDADVRIKNEFIKSAITMMKSNKLTLLSLFPKQEMTSWGERISVPLMNYILLTLLPLRFVQKSWFSSHSAANGQCMMFNADDYKRLQPHERVKTQLVEDVAIARLLKRSKHTIACLLGNDTISCRMYHHYNEAVNGFSRNILQLFGSSAMLAILFWFITTLGFIPILVALPTTYLIAYVLAYLLIRILVSYASKQSIWRNCINFIPQQLTLGFIIYKGIYNRLIHKHEWKGRVI